MKINNSFRFTPFYIHIPCLADVVAGYRLGAPIGEGLDKAVDMVINGEIPDGKTQTLIMRVAEMLRRGIIE